MKIFEYQCQFCELEYHTEVPLDSDVMKICPECDAIPDEAWNQSKNLNY